MPEAGPSLGLHSPVEGTVVILRERPSMDVFFMCVCNPHTKGAELCDAKAHNYKMPSLGLRDTWSCDRKALSEPSQY